MTTVSKADAGSEKKGLNDSDKNFLSNFNLSSFLGNKNKNG